MEKSFAQLVRSRIEDAYDGRQVDFARATGFKPQTVNTWLKGRVTLPQLDARRILARELGVSMIDLMISMGELERSDVETAGVRGVVNELPLPSEVRDILKDITWTQDNTLSAVNILRLIRDVPTARDKENNG